MSIDPQKEELIFETALAFDNVSDRARYLEEACADDEGLRRSVERLLECDNTDDHFLETPPLHVVGRPIQQPGDRVGRYQLVEKLGEGGFGVVWLADQLEPVKRKVALKIIKMGMDTEQLIARFEAERQSLALMQHPNIATVLDVGSTDEGRPYFAMELVKGENISDYADRQRLTIPDRLRLFVQVCEALQHAHQKGIVHRDLKPSNILVTVEQGRSVPKVIDFGIAKAIAGTDSAHGRSVTNHSEERTSEPAGTPAYMSPEQRAGSTDIDTRADIYGLGGVLHTLLVGVAPAAKPSRRILRSNNANEISELRQSTPYSLQRALQGDLEWIAAKALHHDRTQRYESTSELARDVKRHLNHHPVSVAPPSAFYTILKSLRRHRIVAIAAGTVLMTLVAAGVASTIGFLQAEAARQDMEFQWQRAEQQRAAAESARQEARAETEKALRFASTVEEVIGFADPAQGHPSDLRIRDKLDDIEKTLLAYERYPLEEARLRRTVGRVYLNLHELQKAEPHLERTLAIRKQHLSRGDSLISQSQVDWSWYLYFKGMFGEADETLSGILPQLREDPGDDLLSALEALSRVRYQQGNLAGRDELASEAWKVAKKLHGEDHPLTIRYQSRASRTTRSQGDFAEAESICRDALQRILKLRKEDHPDVAAIKVDLGRSLVQQRKLEEAEQLGREALVATRKVLGDDSIFVLGNMLFLIQVLDGQRARVDDALDMARQAAAQADRVVSMGEADDYRCMMAWQILAKLAPRGSTELNDAAQKAFEIQSELPPRSGFARSLRELGFSLRQLGQLRAAGKCLRKAVASDELMGNDQRVAEQFQTRYFLTDLLREQGELELALAELRLAIDIPLSRRAPRRRVNQLIGRIDFVELLLQLGKIDRAREAARTLSRPEALDGPMRRVYSVVLPLVLDGLASLAEGKSELAETAFLDARDRLPLRNASLITQRIDRLIARSHLEQGRFDLAESRLLKLEENTQDARAQILQLSHRLVVLQLVELYERWDRGEQAKQWRRQLGR